MRTQTAAESGEKPSSWDSRPQPHAVASQACKDTFWDTERCLHRCEGLFTGFVLRFDQVAGKIVVSSSESHSVTSSGIRQINFCGLPNKVLVLVR